MISIINGGLSEGRDKKTKMLMCLKEGQNENDWMIYIGLNNITFPANSCEHDRSTETMVVKTLRK